MVDPQTGEYSTTIKSPTGIASDPALAGYGVVQAKQLATHLASLDPPVDLIYSSPFYRCLQTLSPFTDRLVEARGEGKISVNVEPGVGEFYGTARFDHPSPASIEVLNTHFKHLKAEEVATIIPSSKGESIPQLHDRLAYCLRAVIAKADADPLKPKALLMCTHAAAMIAIGRALTGRMPEDECEDDFKCGTCSFSKFTRRSRDVAKEVESDAPVWSADAPDKVPDIGWRGGKGVGGGWNVEVNGDCSFLENGEERTW